LNKYVPDILKFPGTGGGESKGGECMREKKREAHIIRMKQSSEMLPIELMQQKFPSCCMAVSPAQFSPRGLEQNMQ